MDEQKALQLKAQIETLIYRFMIVQNKFIQVSAAGFSMTELRVTAFIGSHERCIMREISDHLLIPKNNLTPIVDKLVRKEIVMRERTETDRRVVYVSLTEKGKDLYQKEMNTYMGLSKGMLSALEPDEQDQLIRLLAKITGVTGEMKQPLT